MTLTPPDPPAGQLLSADRALDRIAALLRYTAAWSGGTVTTIAEIVQQTGRTTDQDPDLLDGAEPAWYAAAVDEAANLGGDR
jgi:hypothetical protein